EGFLFAVEELDKGMGHCAVDRNSSLKTGQNITRSGCTSYIRGSCGKHTGLRTVSTATTEIDNTLSPGGQTQPRRLRRHHGLHVDRVDQVGFQNLSFDHRSCHLQYRFILEKWGAFRHGINVACETKITQVIEKIIRDILEGGQLSQIGNRLWPKLDVCYVMKSLFQPGSQKKGAASW